MAGLVPPHHAGFARPCSTRHPAGCAVKKHLKIRCHSACRISAGYCAASYGVALTLSSTCYPGRHGDARTSAAPSNAATSDAAAYLLLYYVYGGSTKFGFSKDDIFYLVYGCRRPWAPTCTR
ncbi:hypothetical protein R69749_07816 [Paraburkholderia domus]|uniref:Uncharacterized protein n=1 Tax=Paraburkholderia nemoris TaxID=2793076 RepID=A0ABN7N966_9BURK|nr:hypothetical protein R69776_07863 [Paraburkholderia nemoris]CAE6894832.1 hypothetical protein R69749_07816 [Paraburkholderia domus]